MHIVTENNKAQSPAPLNAIYKWAEWHRWIDSDGVEWIEYTIRMTPPLPAEQVKLLDGVNLIGEKSAFFQVLSIEGEDAAKREGEVTVYPFTSYGFRMRADEFFTPRVGTPQVVVRG